MRGEPSGARQIQRWRHEVGSKEGENRGHREQRQAEIADAVQKLNFLEGQGVDVQVGPNGEVDGFIPGVTSAEEATEWDRVGIVYEDLQQMHKSEQGRGIILEAWKRFQEEER